MTCIRGLIPVGQILNPNAEREWWWDLVRGDKEKDSYLVKTLAVGGEWCCLSMLT